MSDMSDKIEAFRLLSIKGRLSLEMKGMRFRPLPGYGSTFNYVKRTYGLNGSKQQVYDAYCNMLREKGVLSNDAGD